jgi:hypothetical protein
MNEKGTLDTSAGSEPSASPTLDLEVAAGQAIAACGGDGREAVKALLVAVDFLEARSTTSGRRFRQAMRAADVAEDLGAL